MVALNAKKISTEDSLRDIPGILRGCYFETEYQLDIFAQYTNPNCLFECSLKWAQSKLNLTSDVPWMFPTSKKANKMSNLTNTQLILQQMTKNVPCPQCLDSCNHYIYQAKISVEPFKTCSDHNLKLTSFCKVGHTYNFKKPAKWSSDVKRQIPNNSSVKLRNIIAALDSDVRVKFFGFDGFKRVPKFLNNVDLSYKAYEKDIAEIVIFFDSMDIFEFRNSPSSTYQIFFSTTGGMLGLCVGINLLTGPELAWLLLRLILMVMKIILYFIHVIFKWLMKK